jgi:hypothetical protein
MKKTIFNVFVAMDSQEQCDRMKAVCLENGLDIYDNFNLIYLKKEYNFFYCSNGDFCNWLELEHDTDYTQVTEAEFLELLKEYKDGIQNN